MPHNHGFEYPSWMMEQTMGEDPGIPRQSAGRDVEVFVDRRIMPAVRSIENELIRSYDAGVEAGAKITRDVMGPEADRAQKRADKLESALRGLLAAVRTVRFHSDEEEISILASSTDWLIARSAAFEALKLPK